MLAGYLQTKKNTYSFKCTTKENRMSLGYASTAVTGVRLSQSIALEVKNVPGFITKDGGTLVATGAGNLFTNNGGSLVADGTANIAINSGSN